MVVSLKWKLNVKSVLLTDIEVYLVTFEHIMATHKGGEGWLQLAFPALISRRRLSCLPVEQQMQVLGCGGIYRHVKLVRKTTHKDVQLLILSELFCLIAIDIEELLKREAQSDVGIGMRKFVFKEQLYQKVWYDKRARL